MVTIRPWWNACTGLSRAVPVEGRNSSTTRPSRRAGSPRRCQSQSASRLLYSMEIELSFDTSGINWDIIASTLKNVGMAHYPPELHKRAFEASHTTVFAWHNGQLIGFGRAISDGVYQAAVYDVAVSPEHQGRGVGSAIIKTIQTRLSHCNLILYASPGKEGFYTTLDFRKMKTGMAHFKNRDAMAAKGFTE